MPTWMGWAQRPKGPIKLEGSMSTFLKTALIQVDNVT